MTTPGKEDLLDRVRKLLAKAESTTPDEAEALTAKAAELMARYGIDQALLGAINPGTDVPGDRVFKLENPWAGVKVHLLAGISSALRGQALLLSDNRVRVYAFTSDLDRIDLMFTSLLVQQQRALAKRDPGYGFGFTKADRRSFMLGFASAVVGRIRAAEEAAAKTEESTAAAAAAGTSTALVLQDRALTVRRRMEADYPRTRKTRVTYSGRAYGDGVRAGQQADIGGSKLGQRPAGALSR